MNTTRNDVRNALDEHARKHGKQSADAILHGFAIEDLPDKMFDAVVTEAMLSPGTVRAMAKASASTPLKPKTLAELSDQYWAGRGAG